MIQNSRADQACLGFGVLITQVTSGNLCLRSWLQAPARILNSRMSQCGFPPPHRTCQRQLGKNCWCKGNCGFALLKFAIWYWNTFLNKCGYVIYIILIYISCFIFYFIFTMNLLAVYFICILEYGNHVRKKIRAIFFYSHAKWVIK